MSATWMLAVIGAIQAALLLVLLVVLVRMTLRRAWLIIHVTVLILSIPAAAESGTTTTWLVVLFPLATGALLTGVVFRSGLLAFAVAWFVWIVTSNIPVMQDMAHWSAAAGNWTLAGLAALAGSGFYASRAGQPLFGTVLKD